MVDSLVRSYYHYLKSIETLRKLIYSLGQLILKFQPQLKYFKFRFTVLNHT